MRYWILWIDDISGTEPVLGSGWVRAESVDRVRSLISHPDMAFTEVPDDTGFPAVATGEVFWDHKAPILNQ
jgi:hypothetical protein